MYLYWNSFIPESWKQGTLKTLLLGAHIVSSNQYLLEKVIQHLDHVFVEVNGYPTWVERQIAQKVGVKWSQIQSSETIDTNEETEQTHTLILPYKGEQGERAQKNISREINRHLPENKKAKE